MLVDLTVLHEDAQNYLTEMDVDEDHYCSGAVTYDWESGAGVTPIKGVSYEDFLDNSMDGI